MEKAGKYEIVRRIGAGGFGVVYEGRDPFIKRRVAIKACTTEDDEIRQRFYREVEIAGNLQHKNIVTVHDFGIEDGIPYLVQEFLTGEDLEHVIARGESIPLDRKLDILIQAARGLAHAHAAGVIHRDIKPANIRILGDGHVKILDFGIAKLAHVESRLTKEGMTVGTAAYLPPEQIKGEKVDFRADVFSFGVVAYELLAMARPFDGKTISTLLYQILSQTPRPLAETLPAIPPRLAAVVDRCLEKDVERRLPSFVELTGELEAVQAELSGGPPVDVVVAPAPAAAERWIRTEKIAPEVARAQVPSATPGTPFVSRPARRGLLAAIAAGVVVLGIAGVWLWRARGGAPAASSVAAAPPELASAATPGPAPVSVAAADSDRPPSDSAPPPAPARSGVAAIDELPQRPQRVEPDPARTRADLARDAPRAARPDASEGPAPARVDRAAAGAPAPSAPAQTETAEPAFSGVAPAQPAPAPAPAAADPVPAVAAPAAVAPALSPEAGVRAALAEYVAAFNRLDKSAVRKIFPTVPDSNFEGLADFQSYRMDLTVSKLDVVLPRVLVEARITHNWVTFSGKRDSSTRKEKMTFLQGPDGAWMRVQ